MLRTSPILRWLLLLSFVGAPAYSETYNLRRVEGIKEELAFRVLELALSKSAPGTKYHFDTENKNEAQLITEIENNKVDIMWSGAAKEKDDAMLGIRIPILKGLLGHRIFIIRKDSVGDFAKINTLEDLKKYQAGQGKFWGDTAVLKNAGLPTVTATKFINLFPMLEGGRYDYFPRAVHEPWIEVEEQKDLGLVVDSHVMLVYPYAMYFYVKKGNQKLHDLIYRGFEMAIEDGSYDELFFNHPMIRDVLEKAKLNDRVVFHIDNPFMHPDTPLDRKEFWLDVSEL